ncbi:hypothetical protein M8994_23115, partial [Brucella sp. 21LCYQ03]|nr:hypothetical protein [Brucella sp. 21LCYQ03]
MLKNIIIICLLIFASCNKQDIHSKEQDELLLQQNLAKILEIANSVPCTNPTDWKYIALGQKACGGPKSYIAYSVAIDTAAFIKMVMDYNRADGTFNVKYGVNSDCAYAIPSQEIICRDGKAQLLYKDR